MRKIEKIEIIKVILFIRRRRLYAAMKIVQLIGLVLAVVMVMIAMYVDVAVAKSCGNHCIRVFISNCNCNYCVSEHLCIFDTICEVGL